MTGFWSIFRRELGAYFVSPVAYVVSAVFMILASLLFYTNVDWYYRTAMGAFQNPYFAQSLNLIEDFVRPLFANLSVILLFIVPSLTMRSFSEEKRSGTFELLLSYPVSDTSIVLGKYFASVAFFAFMTLLTFVYPIFLFWVSDPELGPILTSYLGYFLMGATFIATGLFSSSTTESQIIAALLAFGFNLTFWIVGWVSPVGGGDLSTVLQYLSIVEHFDPLTKGILNSKDIIYFLSAITLFLFLTNRVLLSKKWRG